MKNGKVKFYNDKKGFGFIIDDTGKDISFHISGANDRSYQEGDSVQFEMGEGNKHRGPIAVNISKTKI